MKWIKLEQLLLEGDAHRTVSVEPTFTHHTLCAQALSLAGGLQQRGVRRMAVHLDDAGELAIALLGAWRAGVSVLLPADLQAHTRERWASHVDLWLTASTELHALYGAPLAPAELDLDACQLSLCTSGSSGEPLFLIVTCPTPRWRR